MTAIPKPKRIIDPDLLKEVAQEPCACRDGCSGDVVAHHVTSKGSGGDDVRCNLMPLCVKHHIPGVHQHSNRWMCDQFLLFRSWLERWSRWDILDDVDQLDLLEQGNLVIR